MDVKKEKGNTNYTRKQFLKTSALATAGLALGMSAKSYGQILGANDRIRFGIVGLHGRGQAHMSSINKLSNSRIEYLCDVDNDVLKDRAGKAKEMTGTSVKTIEDVRALVEKKDIDAVSIAAPEHWHVPMALLGLSAGKHIYVEKPLSHNPQEGEWMVTAEKKHPHLVIQMGNQQRSADTSIEAVQLIREGIIGNAYYGKAWYANNRGSIGNGKSVPVPKRLNWDLWQGPAPRVQYRDNIVHYNWHWFRHWGIGEIGNNGLHEMDFCRWALGVGYPTKATSSGGRYQYRDDDWEFYDSQIASFEFGKDDNKMLSWEGLSCNPHKFYGRGRGSLIRGTKGSMIVDRAGYEIYDLDGKIIKERKESGDDSASKTSDTVGGGSLTDKHFRNFAEAIRGKEKPRSPMSDGQKSTLLCHLGNISQTTGRTLHINPQSGKIKNDAEATKMWYRDYQPGWKPKV